MALSLRGEEEKDFLLDDNTLGREARRPQVSDDNPFSEAQFKTLKYHPGFPGRFHDITAAIAFCRTFFPWYNTEHRHGGIAMLTPDDVCGFLRT